MRATCSTPLNAYDEADRIVLDVVRHPGATGFSAPDAIVKHDVATRRTQSVAFGHGREPGEFVFVPSTADAAEDEGVAMGFVYDRSTDRSDLVLLDGQTLETVATVHLPARVPHGFHGNWVPTEG